MSAPLTRPVDPRPPVHPADGFYAQLVAETGVDPDAIASRRFDLTGLLAAAPVEGGHKGALRLVTDPTLPGGTLYVVPTGT